MCLANIRCTEHLTVTTTIPFERNLCSCNSHLSLFSQRISVHRDCGIHAETLNLFDSELSLSDVDTNLAFYQL